MRVLLVEDEADLGQAIKQVLVSEKYVVDWVPDGVQAWLCLESQWTDYSVAIIDWMLPGLSGLELCQKLRSHQNPLPVLMLTALGQPENRVAGLDAGADDYLVKPFVMAELLARLRALQRRSPQLQPQHLSVGAFTLDDANNALRVTGTQSPKTIPLTVKEFQILTYLMQNPNRILPGSKIRQQLWDMEEEPISNSDRSRKTGGAGLGLAIVQAIAHHHQGYLTVTSKPDQGSTFSAYLPLLPQKLEQEMQPNYRQALESPFGR